MRVDTDSLVRGAISKGEIMLNQITLIGNLGNDAEVQADGKLLKLSVATSNNYKNKMGEWVNSTEWHSVKLWHDKAQEMASRFTKGSRVLVLGSIATFETRENYKVTFIKAKSVKSLGPSKSQGDGW